MSFVPELGCQLKFEVWEGLFSGLTAEPTFGFAGGGDEPGPEGSGFGLGAGSFGLLVLLSAGGLLIVAIAILTALAVLVAEAKAMPVLIVELVAELEPEAFPAVKAPPEPKLEPAFLDLSEPGLLVEPGA